MDKHSANYNFPRFLQFIAGFKNDTRPFRRECENGSKVGQVKLHRSFARQCQGRPAGRLQCDKERPREDFSLSFSGIRTRASGTNSEPLLHRDRLQSRPTKVCSFARKSWRFTVTHTHYFIELTTNESRLCCSPYIIIIFLFSAFPGFGSKRAKSPPPPQTLNWAAVID